eukprot:TRINITY_DN6995_c0_g1_i1.p1 TRINITY_DN6995_c0_g1~~TRINITY_DN6995_c0_g1_i1.p1  ORF type:complete len:257 (-),score=48.35 TRINITY_DN6995_c0_g1_i1:197-877(-)
MESSGPLPGVAWTAEAEEVAVTVESDDRVTFDTDARVPTADKECVRKIDGPVRSPVTVINPSERVHSGGPAKHMQAELKKMLDELFMLQWCFQRLSQYYGRMQLSLSVALAVVAALTAAIHQALAVADLERFQGAFVVAVCGLQAVLISAIGYSDPASSKSECLTVSKGYGAVATRLKFVLSRQTMKLQELESALLDVQMSSEQLVQQTNIQKPDWVNKAWAKRQN